MSEEQSTYSANDLATGMRLTVMRLARRLRQQVDGPVTPSQISALHQVERLQPVTLGDLASAERISPPSMTRIVAGLEENAWVVREVDANDRRISRLSLTTEGRKLIERGRTRKTAYLVARMRKLEADDLQALERALPVLERLLQEDS